MRSGRQIRKVPHEREAVAPSPPRCRYGPEPRGGLPPAESFDALGLPPELMRTMTDLGVTEPFPIQAATLPNALAGRDVLGRARTGSGKTLAFGLALLVRTAGLRAESKRPLALVLVPTRELAQQVERRAGHRTRGR